MMEPEEDFPDYSKEDDAADLLELSVPLADGGLRLDQALAKLVPQYSRSRLQDWIGQGLVTVNGSPATVKHKVWGGERICVSPQIHPSDQTSQAEDIPLDIVYEDEAIIVLDKPVGLVVHPGSGNWQGTLLNALLFHAPELKNVPRAGIVHRLDKDTSGLMVVAKTLVTQTALVRQMQARSVKREYLALVWGELDHGGTVDLPIGRHPSQRVKMAVIENGKEAITHYTIEANFPGCTFVRCRLETGRTHQIRVHLAYIGHPLVGDRVYQRGVPKCVPQLRELLNGFPRQALHATRLALAHPLTGEQMEWESPLPEDMAELLDAIDEAGDESA
ncbi:MAG: 23S rRNA pseudouridine(1911/1915/1917) synthase RluD [Gallionella sp.]|nr:23S rRNA pseudouridine(1911/1915/1917) synthase RluD [Gallionella sp.]NCP80648.1 23S rRNA pseudouridine(1911/1915/1917) synthase RluD [Gallionella sp.]